MKARQVYDAITKECPEYTDAWLRLGVMARDEGDYERVGRTAPWTPT